MNDDSEKLFADCERLSNYLRGRGVTIIREDDGQFAACDHFNFRATGATATDALQSLKRTMLRAIHVSAVNALRRATEGFAFFDKEGGGK